MSSTTSCLKKIILLVLEEVLLTALRQEQLSAMVSTTNGKKLTSYLVTILTIMLNKRVYMLKWIESKTYLENTLVSYHTSSYSHSNDKYKLNNNNHRTRLYNRLNNNRLRTTSTSQSTLIN
jgi:hypothetical protein